MNAPVIGLYHPTGSPVHRLPAGLKLAVLVVAGVGSIFVRTPVQVAGIAVALLLAHAAALIPPRVALRLARPLLFLMVPLGVFHVLVSNWQRAVVVVGVLTALMLLANLVTLTTRTSDLIDVVVTVTGPLRRFGAHPERLGLLLHLGIRAVPVVFELAQRTREAQRARGLTSSPRAFAVPLIVGALRHADALGDALAARGLDD